MNWNIEDIVFLYPPDSYTGSFDNAKMQARHEQQMQEKLEAIKNALTRETDPVAAMHKLHARDQLTFLRNNLESFRHAGRVEKAVLAVCGRLMSLLQNDEKICNRQVKLRAFIQVMLLK